VTIQPGIVGGYLALFLVLALSWAGLPIAGQAALVAAGAFAASGDLNLALVLLVGVAASALGGMVGYRLGVWGGRVVWTARGPFRHRRARALARGERLFDRYGAVAVLLVPMWVAGIYRMRWRSFVRWNLLAAAVWTAAGGLGGYFVGTAIAGSLGIAALALLGAALALAAASALYRRYRSAT
jgi:membrane protein DedA with SNARE-associated domain